MGFGSEKALGEKEAYEKISKEYEDKIRKQEEYIKNQMENLDITIERIGKLLDN